MIQAPNFQRLLCWPKFESQQKSNEVESCEKKCVSFPYLVKACSYLFKWVNKTFFAEKFFIRKISNLIPIIIVKDPRQNIEEKQAV